MVEYKTKSLRAEWEVLSREYENAKFLELTVYKKNCKKPFYHLLIDIDQVKDISLMREIGNAALNNYKTFNRLELEEELSELQSEVLEWLVEYLMDSLIAG